MDLLFSLISGVDNKSYLDVDDLNGIGKGNVPERTGNKAIDFALFKINLFAVSENTSDRKNFIKDLVDTFRELGPKAEEFSVPLLQSLLNESSEELRAELSGVLPDLTAFFMQEVRNLTAVKEGVLPIFRELLSNDSHVINESAAALVEASQHLNTTETHNEVISIVLDLVNQQMAENSIVVGLDLISQLAKSFGSEICEKFLVSVIQFFAEDGNPKFKKELAECLCSVSEVVSTEVFHDKLLSVFLSLCRDTNWQVKKVCAENLVKVLKISNEDIHSKELFGVVKDLVKNKNKWVSTAAKSKLGLILYYYKGKNQEKLLKMYCKSAENGELGYSCAYYFPGVLVHFGGDYWQDLKKLFFKLNSLDAKTKECLVASVHEIAKVLGPHKTETELVEVFEEWLNTPSVALRAYKALGEFLQNTSSEAVKLKFIPYVESMQKAEAWRVRETLAEQLNKFTQVYTPEEVFQRIWPLGVALCQDKMHTVRQTAALELGRLSSFLLKNYSEQVQSVLKFFSRSPNYHYRQVFVEIAKGILETTQNNFLEEEIETLTKDKVSNVRLSVAQLLRQSKSLWPSLKTSLEEDENPDVRYQLCERPRGTETLNGGFYLTPPIFRPSCEDENFEVYEVTAKEVPHLESLENYSEIN